MFAALLRQGIFFHMNNLLFDSCREEHDVAACTAQDRLCRSSVLVIGAGGLGCPAAIYLAAAGVGRLGIMDKDYVEMSNIHRQILHREQDIGVHKAVSAAAACRAINSTIKVQTASVCTKMLEGALCSVTCLGSTLGVLRLNEAAVCAAGLVCTHALC